MYKITAPVLSTEKAWGLNFVNGMAETDSEYLASKLGRKGYKIEDIETPNPSKFDGMEVEQLKAYAAEHNIDIGNSSSVNGILKKITEAEKTA